MQIEKFKYAQFLTREIDELKILLKGPVEIKSLDKLSVESQRMLQGKVDEVFKKEITKIIKIKEKEFSDL